MPLSRREAGSFDPPPHPPGTPEALRDALRDAESETERRTAALDLGGVAGSEAALIAALREEKSAGVREAIVTALVSMATEEAASALASCFAGEDVALRNAAVEGLQQIGLPAADPVRRCLASDDPDVRIFAATALGAVPHPDVARWLIEMLAAETDVSVGLAIVEAFAHFGTADGTAPLRAFAARFPDEPQLAYAVDLVCSRVAACRAA